MEMFGNSLEVEVAVYFDEPMFRIITTPHKLLRGIWICYPQWVSQYGL